MLFAASAPTPYDLRFDLFGFPVRVHPAFWIIALLLFPFAEKKLPLVLGWVLVAFVSILAHELGHAFLQRAYGGRPTIVLYAFGGVARADDARLCWWRSILVALAGPLAGFVLALVGAGLLSRLPQTANPLLVLALNSLFWINMVWGVVNLLPIWPLDGGHVARELLVRFLDPSRGVVWSLGLSFASAIVFGYALFVYTHSLWNLALFGFLAYQSYQTLSAYRRSRW